MERRPNLVLRPKRCLIQHYYEFYFTNESFDCIVYKRNRRNNTIISVENINESQFLAFRVKCLSNGFYMDMFDLDTEGESD